MCGIHFVINDDSASSKYNVDKFLSDAFYANQVRGTDSSGMFQVKRYLSKGKPDVSFHKDALNGSAFLQDRSVRDLITASKNARATVCHVRAATMGGVRLENAHPFIAKREDDSRIIGVHNGTLSNWRSKQGSEKFNVDSQWLFSKLASDGAEAFAGFDGAWALVWYDSNTPDIMYIARNDKRPLFYAFSEDQKSIVGASELGMLGWLAERNDIKLHKNDKGVRFLYPPAGMIMSLNIKTFETTFTPYAEYKATTYARPAVQYTAPANSTVIYPTRPPYNWQDEVMSKIATALKTVVEDKSSEAPFAAEEPLVSDTYDEAGFEAAVKAEADRFLAGRAAVDEDEPAHSFINVKTLDEHDLGYIQNPLARRGASAEERRRAKDKGLFGLIVEYVGYWYDESDNCVYGDITMKEGDMEVSYDASLRAQTKASSERYVNINSMSPNRMVVIGQTKPVKFNADKPYLIVAPIQADDVIRKFDIPKNRVVN